MKRIASIWLVFLSLNALAQPRYLEEDSLMNDIDLLEGIITQVHPGIYRYNDDQAVTQIFDQLKEDAEGGHTEREWMIHLAQATAKIRCGHTYVNPWNMKAPLRDRLFSGSIYFPIGFKIINGQFVVTENYSDDPTIATGNVISSINGITTATIMDSLRTVAKMDGHNDSPVEAYFSLDNFTERHWEAFDIYHQLFFPAESSFRLKVDQKGIPYTTEVNGLTKQERAERAGLVEPEKWSLRYEDGLAVMKLNTFSTWNWSGFDYQQWLADAFRELDSLGIQNLAIDLRGNGGGLGEISSELLSYLTDKPISCADEAKALIRTTKVDAQYQPYSETWVEAMFTGLPKEMYRPYQNGFYELAETFECAPIIPKAKTFAGKTYFLGGSTNVSATSTLLRNVKEMDNITFVGTETGGNRQGINGGAFIFFYLPYSEAEVDIPLKFFSYGSNEVDAGVQPDYYVDYSRQDILEGRDPYLAFVRELIANEVDANQYYLQDLLSRAPWKGELTYQDYSANKKVSIPADLSATSIKEGKVKLNFSYPDEPHANYVQAAKIDLTHHKLDKAEITDCYIRDGILTLVTEEEGKDGGQNARIKMTYAVGQNNFTITKEYKLDGTTNYQFRNEYAFVH